MAGHGRTYTFEVAARLLMTAEPTSPIDEFHRALAQAALEAIVDGRDGFSVQGMQRGSVGFLQVRVPAQVASDGRWLWRRSVL